jgi:hypothetical protein
LVAGGIATAVPATAVLATPYTHAFVDAPDNSLTVDTNALGDFGPPRVQRLWLRWQVRPRRTAYPLGSIPRAWVTRSTS